MTLQRRFRTALLVTSVISLLAYGAGEQSLGLPLLAGVGAVSGWWVTERRGKGGWKGLPRWLSTLALGVMLIGAVTKALQGQSEVVSAFTGFLASIIVVKLWERRELRDYAQVLTMSLFLTVGATLNNNSLFIGLLLLVEAPALVYTVMLFQMYAAGERVRQASFSPPTSAPPHATPAAAPSEVPWAPIRRAFTRASVIATVAGVAIAAVVFVFVPRGIGLQEWGEFASPRNAQIGFTDEVEPGANEMISASQVAVLEVQLTDDRSATVGAPGERFYLRGAVLDRYDPVHGRWVRSSGGRSVRKIPASYSLQEQRLSDDLPQGRIVHQQLRELSSARGKTPMFALYRPVSLMLEQSQASDIDYDPEADTISREGDGTRSAYTITSILDPAGGAATERRRVSFPSPAIHNLASDVLRRAGFDPDPDTRPISEDAGASRVLEGYLRSNYEYTLAPGAVPAAWSATEYFLFTSKKGHCEYFASALAAMCRSVGIEARVVAGYVASEFHPDLGSYIVRAADAHAWVEVYTGAGGWQRRDGTPADMLAAAQSSRGGLWARIMRMSASVEDLWNSAVVAFDQNAQNRLLGRIGDAPRHRFLETLSDKFHSLIDRVRSPARIRGGWPAWVMILGASMLGLGMVWVATRAWTRRRSKANAAAGWAMHGAERRAYRQLLEILARRGYPKPAWLPPLRHVRDIAGRDAELAHAAAGVVELIYSARFGGAGAAAIHAANRQIQKIRETGPRPHQHPGRA